MTSDDRPVTLLIVEDEALVAADLKAKLERSGYTVVGTAVRGREALEMARRCQPELVLMDIRLAGCRDGIQTAAAIQKDVAVPVVYLTAYSDPATLSRAKLTQPFGYILKPFEVRDLVTQIELALTRHRIEKQLRESAERYRNIFKNNHAVLLLIDPRDGRIVDANPAACAFYGYRYEQLSRMQIAQINILTPDQIADEMRAAQSSQRCHFYFQHRLADGRIRDVEVFCGPVTYGERQLLYSIVHDITDRKRAEKALHQLNATLEEKVAERTRLAERRARQLKALAEELECAEERERQRIAHLLHDDVQQILASARLRLQLIDPKRPCDTVVTQVVSLLDEAAATMRYLSHDLSSDALRHAELEKGLQRLASRMNQQHDLVVDLEINLPREVTDELLKVFVLRTVGELLFNVVKHAGIKAAAVQLTTSENRLSIRVNDGGKGFNPNILEDAGTDTGIGLLSLRRRARYMGGDLMIESVPGKGSQFHLTLPLTPGTHAED
jgi:PAS domain S-box-containing protein